MYLILGNPAPSLADPLFALLKERGGEILYIPSFTPGISFNWVFGKGRSASKLQFADGRTLRENMITAAIIHKFSQPEEDVAGGGHTYDVRAEQEAAWFGWFWSLRCPVINRYPPIFWFSKSIPVSLWRQWLRQSGLCATDAALSNSSKRLKAFASSLAKEVIYSPLSIDKIYRLDTEEDWSGVRRLAALFPVNLTSFDAPLYFASIVGGNVFWNKAVPPILACIEPSLIKLVTAAGLSFVEVGLLVADGQPRVHSINPFPKLTKFKPERCQAIANALVDEMQSASGKPLKRPSRL